jgi:hypothetical protein
MQHPAQGPVRPQFAPLRPAGAALLIAQMRFPFGAGKV